MKKVERIWDIYKIKIGKKYNVRKFSSRSQAESYLKKIEALEWSDDWNHQICTKCWEIKLKSEFGKRKDKRMNARCLECKREKSRKYMKLQVEENNAYAINVNMKSWEFAGKKWTVLWYADNKTFKLQIKDVYNCWTWIVVPFEDIEPNKELLEKYKSYAIAIWK